MAGEQKTRLAEIVAGDEVALRTGHYPYALQRHQVTRVTSGYIIIAAARFRKTDGREVGTGIHKATIFPLGAQRYDAANQPLGTYAAWLDSAQAAQQEACAKYAIYIGTLNASTLLARFDAATLEQAARLLGYTDDID